MAQVELIMPKMGESIMEATILRWLKKPGDLVEADETILEIATDKVDSEIPSPVAGVLSEIFFHENDVVPVGKAIAILSTEASASPKPSPAVQETAASNGHSAAVPEPALVGSSAAPAAIPTTGSSRFYSPLVKNIAKTENIALTELEQIEGSGMQGRVTKRDVLAYVENRGAASTTVRHFDSPQSTAGSLQLVADTQHSTFNTQHLPPTSPNVEIIEMDRMRRLIADHMVMSKQVSPHVTSFVEADVTNMVKWREKNKDIFFKKYGEKITFTPFFVEAVAKAIGDYPRINVSVEDNRILLKKDVNIGMAAALPSGNLIVPVIRNANFLNLPGLTKTVNDLANRARENKLKPDEIQNGTFTLTNVGTFGNVMGTPIINQPQVAILATGAIRKKPAVVETEYGDLIAIRQLMFLSLSYDHRVVDGALGGSFLRRVADYLEGFDPHREV